MLHHKMTKTELEHFFGSDDLLQGNSQFNSKTKQHFTFKRMALDVFYVNHKYTFLEILSKTKGPNLHWIREKVIYS